jgi:hypothetical protein
MTAEAVSKSEIEEKPGFIIVSVGDVIQTTKKDAFGSESSWASLVENIGPHDPSLERLGPRHPILPGRTIDVLFINRQ